MLSDYLKRLFDCKDTTFFSILQVKCDFFYYKCHFTYFICIFEQAFYIFFVLLHRKKLLPDKILYSLARFLHGTY